MQTGILDSRINYNSQDEDNMPSINMTANLFVPVNNSKHKQNYNQNKENRDQNKERTHSVNAYQELLDINQKGNQTTHTNKEISEKKQLFIGNLHSDTTEDDIYKLFGLRSTQYLNQNCLVNMPLVDKIRKSKGFAFIVTPEKVHQKLMKLNGINLLGRKI